MKKSKTSMYRCMFMMKKTYDTIKVKTTLGSDIIKRIEPTQMRSNLVRAYTESTITPERMRQFINKEQDIDSQIILLADIYLTLRSAKSYKRPYTHNNSISLIENQIGPFF